MNNSCRLSVDVSVDASVVEAKIFGADVFSEVELGDAHQLPLQVGVIVEEPSA